MATIISVAPSPNPSRKGRGAVVVLCALALSWPALLNGYPLVFADTGTYLSQAVHRYLGWDRPVFYSLFLYLLHWQVTTWPVVAAQAILSVWVIAIVLRVLAPRIQGWGLGLVIAVLAVSSSLPWTVSELMPDLFTPLMVLALALLAFAPWELACWERAGLVVIAGFAAAAHLSNLLLAFGLSGVLIAVEQALWGRWVVWRPVLPALAATSLLVGVNVAAGRGATISPYGNVFLLARVIADGPGRDFLIRSCAAEQSWRLCPYLDRLPDSADGFLWRKDSPLYAAGGPKLVSREAGAIVRAAVTGEPARAAEAVGRNVARQLAMFATGDGLQPWPAEVSPWIMRDFPFAEAAAYEASRQTRGAVLVLAWLGWLHFATGLIAVAGLCAGLPWALRKRDCWAAFSLIVLAALVENAIITGGLSGPHDRYQSRVMWLPVLIGVAGVIRVLQR